MSKYNISKYDSVQDYLAAHGYKWNKDTECYEQPIYMSDTRKIPWGETKGYTVDTFPAKARARGWVPEDGKVAALADAEIATISATRITAGSLTVSAPRPLDLKKMFSDEGMRGRFAGLIQVGIKTSGQAVSDLKKLRFDEFIKETEIDWPPVLPNERLGKFEVRGKLTKPNEHALDPLSYQIVRAFEPQRVESDDQ